MTGLITEFRIRTPHEASTSPKMSDIRVVVQMNVHPEEETARRERRK